MSFYQSNPQIYDIYSPSPEPMRSFLSPFILFVTMVSCSPKAPIKTLCRLPKNINESSGISINPDGTLWTHNDSGDKPRIYKLDSLGKILQTLQLRGATAYDYEDITRDRNGNLYVCDFGNNFNNRRNLCIYKISHAELESGADTVNTDVIHFNYPDQSQFPPPKKMRNFDCESIVILNDSIFIFSKNRGNSHFSRRYFLPIKPGTYTAVLIDSVKTRRWITSAALSPDNKILILLSENRLNIFTGFTGSHFFIGKQRSARISITQKEGIAFRSNKEIYLTDEVFKGIGGKIYYADISKFIR
jgi:hypothetical protein